MDEQATAVCVVERQERVLGRDAATMAWNVKRRLRLRFAERMAAGTGYLEAVAAVKKLIERAGVGGACEVVADASGVGEAVVEVMRKQAGVRVKAVRIKGGGTEQECGAESVCAGGEDGGGNAGGVGGEDGAGGVVVVGGQGRGGCVSAGRREQTDSKTDRATASHSRRSAREGSSISPG
jgi:hypothetical protein